jgi:hypothetical protein
MAVPLANVEETVRPKNKVMKSINKNHFDFIKFHPPIFTTYSFLPRRKPLHLWWG